MNGRRGFLKTLVGAFVASAVEIHLAREPEAIAAPRLTEFEEYHKWLQQAVGQVWCERYAETFRRMGGNTA